MSVRIDQPAPPRTRTRVLAALEADNPFNNAIMRGLGRWLGENPRSGVVITRCDVRDPAPDLSAPDLSAYDAIVYFGGHKHFDSRLASFNGPAINITGHANPLPANSIFSDEHAAARLAIEHLHEYGRSEIVVATDDHAPFHFNRTRAFLEIAKQIGFTPQVVQLPLPQLDADGKHAINTLRACASPPGVFATDDVIAQRLCIILDAVQMACPEDVAIVSLGNDVNICEFTHPPVSSIDNAVDLRGYRAMVEILRQLQGGKPLREPIRIMPRGVVVRRSSDSHAVPDPDVRLALGYIHEHADEPIKVADVVKHVGIGRRTLELKFNKHLQRTVHDEIWRAHTGVARQLLLHTDLAVYDIAARSGFGTLSNFCTIFRRRERMTPNEYRQLHRGRE